MSKILVIISDGMGAVFRRPHNVAIAILTAITVLFAAVWLSNRELLGFVLFSETFSFSSKVMILLKSFGGLMTNFTAASRTVTVLIAALFGINIAMTVHYLRTRIALERSMGTSFAGALVGMFGVGCASCGSALLSVFFGTAFTASVVGALPFRGLEFGLLGVATLVLSLYLTSKKIIAPSVCKT